MNPSAQASAQSALLKFAKVLAWSTASFALAFVAQYPVAGLLGPGAAQYWPLFAPAFNAALASAKKFADEQEKAASDPTLPPTI